MGTMFDAVVVTIGAPTAAAWLVWLVMVLADVGTLLAASLSGA
jgi:hypothetical protein